MTGRELPAKATLVLPADVFLVLRLQLGEAMGTAPTRAGVTILLGQMALETGRFKACQNYNLGGIKCSKKWPGCWQHFTTTERLPMAQAQKYLAEAPADSTVEIVQRDGDLWTIRFRGKHPVNKFVAFENLEAAVAHHVAFLLGRYRESVDIAMTGDATGYANSLYRLGYYTGSREDYGRSILSLGREYDRTMPADATTVSPDAITSAPVTIAASVTASYLERTGNAADGSITLLAAVPAEPVTPREPFTPTGSFPVEVAAFPQIGKPREKASPWWWRGIIWLFSFCWRKKQ